MGTKVSIERTDGEYQVLRKKLSNLLEKNYDPDEYAKFFFEDCVYAKDILYECLEKEGYPEKIDWSVLRYEPKIEKCKFTFDKWADIAMQSYLKEISEEGIDEFVEGRMYLDMYNLHYRQFEFKMDFEKTVEEYLDIRPTWEHAVTLIRTAFDSNEFLQYMKENHEEFYLGLLKETAKQEGFKSDVDLRQIKASFRFSLTSDKSRLMELADASFGNYNFDAYGSASDFVDAQINAMCYDNFYRVIRHKVIILSDPNESLE